MLTSKNRAKLRGLANTMESILQVGKGGVGAPLVTQVNDALEARELIKLTVLETCPDSAKDVAVQLAGDTDSEVVQVIGRKVTLYRRNIKKPVITLD